MRLSVLGSAIVVMLVLASPALAAPYLLEGHWVEVDYWAGAGASETVLVIDWNQTNGPYVSEAHAWGYRWDGDATLADALAAVAAAGPLEVVTGYGGGFLLDAFYADADGDQHTSDGFSGWWWIGESADGGATWTANAAGIDQKTLAPGRLEGFNMDSGAWTSATLTVPVPEPATCALVAAALVGLFVRRKVR